jgi:prepilin-type N-terminal cleavage/methylation domain-containing protein
MIGPVRESRGFTLLEVITVVLIVGLMAVVLAPLASDLMDTTRANGTFDELGRIYSAIVGNPNLNTFGYLGDVGDYPSSLMDLVQNPGVSGWNGPYLNDARVVSGAIYDEYGGQIEYYHPSTTSLGYTSTDLLAIISKGPTRGTDNTNATPNQSSGFNGTAPSSASYATINPKAIVYPRAEDNSGLVNYQDLGTVSYNIANYDNNTNVASVVPGCPNYWNLKFTSATRSADTFTLVYNPGGISVDLVQGLYNVRVYGAPATTDSWNEQAAVKPGPGQAHSLTLWNVDSSATTTFTLTVYNTLGFQIAVNQLGGAATNINSGAAPGTLTVNGCNPITVKNNTGAKPVIDTFIMPYMAYTKRYNTNNSYSLTVTNGGANSIVYVYNDGLLIGTVGSKGNKRGKTFLNVKNGNTIRVTNSSNADVNLSSPFTMPAGPASFNAP